MSCCSKTESVTNYTIVSAKIQKQNGAKSDSLLAVVLPKNQTDRKNNCSGSKPFDEII